jgi:hypothetical protein
MDCKHRVFVCMRRNQHKVAGVNVPLNEERQRAGRVMWLIERPRWET